MPSSLCEHCTAVCCRYIALPIDKPRTRKDFEDIRWYLAHENVVVFVEDGDWYISFLTPCRYLTPDNRCGIYERRPAICRRYRTTNCDYHTGEYKYDFYFTRPEELAEYVEQFVNGSGRLKKSRKRPTRASGTNGRARAAKRSRH